MTTPRKKETFLTRYTKNFELLFKAMGFIPLIARGSNRVIQAVFPPLANFFNGLSQLAKDTTSPMKYVYQALNIAFIGLAVVAAATAIPALLSAAGWAAAALTAISWGKNAVIPAIRARAAYLNTPSEQVAARQQREQEYNQCKNDVAWGLLTVLAMSLMPLGTVTLLAASVALPVLPLVGLGGVGLLAFVASRAEIRHFAQAAEQNATLAVVATEAQPTSALVKESKSKNSLQSMLSSLQSTSAPAQSPAVKSSSPSKTASYSFSSFLSPLISPFTSKPVADSDPKQKSTHEKVQKRMPGSK